ncbi:MAG: T9SS type A sorting domain-containing protein [Bacteroidota bacterium]|nr:T9SS type A sorting domain-containing protein [Bacteroidota bacterium]
MNKVTACVFAAFFSISAHIATAQFGFLVWSGQSSADLYLGRLTDPNYTKVEFYRGAKKLGEIVQGGPNAGIVTDYGLQKGVTYSYQFRAYRTAGGYMDGNVSGGFIWGGDIRGILTRKDSISIRTDLVDSVFIYPGGPVNPEVSVPGGELHFAPGCDLSYSVAMSGRVSGIRVLDTEDPRYPPGKISASGGKLKDLNIECYGQADPINGLTLIGGNLVIYNPYVCRLNGCSLNWLTDQGRYDFALIESKHFTIKASNCTVDNTCQLLGCETADKITVDHDGTLSATHVTNSDFKNNGQLLLRPFGVPASCRYSRFRGGTSNSSISLNNKSVVEYNVLEAMTTVTLSSIGGAFDSADVADVHINFNEFQREENVSTIISTVAIDTIDVTKNYWGDCYGPSYSERIGRAARFDPFLRVKYPQTSYWFDIGSDKNTIIADGEDEIVFTGHFWNVLEETDSAGATVDYLVRVLGDTLAKGVLTMDANGMCRLPLKLDVKYRAAITMEVYFRSIQCIEKTFLIKVIEPAGSDLTIMEGDVIQTILGEDGIIAGKPFFVRATITAEEPVTASFPVQVKVNGVAYDTFYVYSDKNLGVKYEFQNPRTTISLPRAEGPLLYFPVQGDGISPGMINVEIIVDPPSPTNPKGVIIEPIESNNTLTIPVKVKASTWGNGGEPTFNVFVQPFETFPQNYVSILQKTTDTAKTFMGWAWPMKSDQVQFTTAPTVVNYSWITPDTLLQETWEYYLMKAYKQARLANPAFDRYIFAVDPDWFATRMHPVDFPHRLSQTLSWSGIYDFMLVSGQSYKYMVHSLGHSFGLRRHDFGLDDIDTQEEYQNYFLAKEIYDAVDPFGRRVIHYGAKNVVGYMQKAYCYMGNSRIPGESYPFVVWTCDVCYKKLQNEYAGLWNSGGWKKSLVPRALFIEGSVDSTTRTFSFGPWAVLTDATPSNMVDSAFATHVFRMLDGSGAELNRYYYRPTFRALGLDEGALPPSMEREYFAFVVPYPAEARKVVVESGGQVVAERVLPANAPNVYFTYPTNGMNVPEGGAFTAIWTADDADGDTDFWYTVYFSRDNGKTWELVVFESQLTQAIIRAPKGMNYKLRIIGSDGVLTGTQEITFNIWNTNDAENLPSPASFTLFQNYPNPFNPSTNIRYSVPHPALVSIEVYDALGRPVETLISREHEPGTYTVVFDADGRPSGTYTAVLKAEGMVKTIRMVLAK